MMRDYFIVDSSKFPLVTGTFQDFVPTAEEFTGWQKKMEDFISTRENFVIIVDFTNVRVFSAEYRINAAKWAAKVDLTLSQKNITMVMCTPSLATRVLMKSILIMFQPRATFKFVSSLEQAYQTASKLLKKDYTSGING